MTNISDKTSYFLDQITENIIENYSDIISDLCIVLPTQRSKFYLLKNINKKLSKTIILPKIISIDDFMVETSGLYKADNMYLLLELFEIYKIESKETNIDFMKFSGWATLFLGDIDDIDKSLNDAKTIFKSIFDYKELGFFGNDEENITEIENKWLTFFHSLFDYYQKLNSNLLKKHIGYTGMIYRFVAENIHYLIDNKTISSSPLKYQKILFCGFNALTKSEISTIKYLIDNNKAEIFWDADNFYLQNEQNNAGEFLRKNFKVFNQTNLKFISNNFKESKKNIKIFAAPNNVSQAKFLSHITANPELYDINLEQTAYVIPNNDILLSLFNSIENKNINYTMGFPLSNTNLLQLINLLLDIQIGIKNISEVKDSYSNKIYFKNLISILNHSYIAMILKHYNFDNIAFISIIQNNNKVYYSTEDIEKILFKNAKKFEQVKHIFSIWNNIDDCLLTFKQLIVILNNIFIKEENLSTESFKNERLFFINSKNQIENLIDNIEKLSVIYNSSLSNFKNIQFLLKNETSSLSINLDGDSTKGVQVLGLLETRALDFKNVVVVSTNENIIPQGYNQNSLIPFEHKKKFDLPTHHYTDAIYAYHFYRLLQRAENIILVYNTDISEGKMEKSRFINQLLLELPKYNSNCVIEHKIINFKNNYSEKKPIKIRKNEEIISKLYNLKYSPSSIIKYIKCPLSFYFAYIEQIKEPQEVLEQIGNDLFGTVVHKVLETIYKPKINYILNKEDIIDFIKTKNLEELILNTFFENNIKQEELRFGKNKIVFEIIKTYLKSYLEYEKTVIENNELIITNLEQNIEYQIEINDKQITLKGSIDRIDMINNIVRIVDYKTGLVQESELKIDLEDDLLFEKIFSSSKTKVFQLLFYAMMAYDNNIINCSEFYSAIISLRKTSEQDIYLSITSKGEKSDKQPKKSLFSYKTIELFKVRLIEEISDILNNEYFEQTKQISNCSYCPYIQICNK